MIKTVWAAVLLLSLTLGIFAASPMNAVASYSPSSIRRTILLKPVAQEFLGVVGKQIVDEDGRYVILRGASFYGLEYGYWDRRTEQDYQRLSSWGFNVVRLPIAWNFIEPQPGVYNESYLSSYVDRDIQWAEKYGIYVILDMHQYMWSPYFTYIDSPTAGVPFWAVSTYLNTAEGEAHAKADFWNGLGPNGTPASAANPSMQDRFIQIWKYVAGRYKSEPAIAAFDLFNEPTIVSHDLSGRAIYFYDPNLFCSSTVPSFLTRVVDAIRTVDDRHIAIWEPAENCISRLSVPLSTITSPVDRPNVVYSPHYPGIGNAMTLIKYSGDRSQLEMSFLNSVIRPSNDWNQPVFVGEYGITVQAPNATQYIRDFVALLNKYSIGAAWWTYGRSEFGMNLLDDSGDERLTLTQNIRVPYVRLSTSFGVSSALGADGKTFNVTTNGPTTLAIYLASSFSLSSVEVDEGSIQATWVPSERILFVTLAADSSTLVVRMW